MKHKIQHLLHLAGTKLALKDHKNAIRNLSSPAMGMADSPTSEQMAAVLELRAEQVQLCERLGMTPPEPPRLSGKGASELRALADGLHRENAELAFQANRQAARLAAPVRLTPIPAKASKPQKTFNPKIAEVERKADEQRAAKAKAAADGMALAIKIGRRITAPTPATATAAPSPEPRKPLLAAMPVPSAADIASAMLDEQERRASAPVGLQKTIAAFQARKTNR